MENENNEILFECNYTRTKSILNEFNLYYCFKQPKFIVCDTMFAFLAVSNIIMLIMGDPQKFEASLIVIALVYLFLKILIFRVRRIAIKRELEINSNQPVIVNSAVFQDYIEITLSNNGTKSSVCFSNIKKAVKTRNLIILITQANLYYLFPKDAFINNSSNDFIAFLKSKGIKIHYCK
ncbi:MAG: YcxB family protein [Bacillota bacterium]|nr:YcxB family protein [Bacillota bacterium]